MAGREYVSKFQLVVDPEEQRRRDAIAQGIVQDELTTAIDAGDARSASHLQQELKNRFSGKTGVAPTFTETPAFASETSAPSSTPDGWTVIDPGWTRKKPQAATPSGWEDVSSQFYYAGAQPKEQQPDDSFTGSMARGIKKTIPELKQAGAGAIAYLGDVFGAEGVKEWGLNKYHEIEDSTKNLQSANDSFSKVVLDGEGSFKAWLGNAVGYSIGQVGLALVSGGVGAIGGKMIAKQGLTKLVEGEIAKSFEKNVAAGMAEEAAKAAAIKTGQEFAAGALVAGRNTGAFTGALLHNETQELGSIYNDAVEQAKKEGRTLDGGDLFRIGASSLAAAGVDTAMEAVNFNKLTKGVDGSKLYKRAAVEIPSGMAREGVTEAVQTGIEQYGAAKPLDTREIIDSAALGAVGGGMAGGGAALRQRQAPTASDAQTIEQAATLPVTPVVSPEDVLAIQPQSSLVALSPREQRQQAVADKLYPLPTQRETAPTADRQLEAINAINPLPEQRDGTIGVRQTPFTDAEIAAGVERAQAPARAIEEAYRLNEREQQDAAYQQAQQPQGATPLAFNDAAATPVIAQSSATPTAAAGGNAAPQVTLRADGQPFATLKAAETSIKARGLSGAVAVSVKGGGFGIRMAAPASAQNTAPAQAVPQNNTASASPAPVQDTSLKATATLAQAIRKFGGLPEKFARDLTGEPAPTANKLPGYRGLFHASGTDLSTLVHDGKLDAYLPPNLRSDVRDDSRPTDTDAAVAHIEAILRNGEAQTAKSYARTEAKQQRLTAAAQKQQVVAPIEKGDTQAAADAISEAEYEHYKQTGEPGFGWADGFDEAASRIEALTDDDLEFAASDKPDTPQSLRDGMASLGFTQQEIDDEVTARFGQAQASAQSVAEPTASTAQSTGTSGTQAPPAAEVAKTGDERARDAELFRKTKSRLIDAFIGKSGENFDELSKTLTARANDKNDPQSKLAAEVLDNFDGWKGNYEQRQAFEKNRESANPNEAAAKALESAAAALREVGKPSAKPADNDFLSELFGRPSSQPAEPQQQQKSGQRGIAAIRAAIRSAIDSAIRERDDWSSRNYKANKKQVELRGDGPGNNAAMSVGSINESRRNKAIESLNQEIAALGKLEKQVTSDSGATQVMAGMSEIMETAKRSYESGNYPGRTVNDLFESILLDRLKFRGPGGKGSVTSNGLSKAALSAITEQTRPALDLTNPTESKLRTDDAKQKRDAAEKAAKENAPSPEEFGLVGSNRAADVGAAAGQEPLFSRADTIEVDGQQRPRNNSNGKPIAATDEGIRNFWKWFADSRVVDDQGRPLVVYHGTTADFSAFDKASIKRKAAGAGFYFSSNAKQVGYSEGEGANVMPVYLAMNKPTDGAYEFRTDAAYDGLIFPLSSSPGVTHFAVRDPNQIKSTTGNTGQFSPDNADIRFSRAAKADPKDLIVQHNLSISNLRHAMRMGGIAVPSLAVTKADAPMVNFGEITLLGDRDLVDPRGYAGTKVFGADIYSPRYPTVSYDLGKQALKNLNEELLPFRDALPDGASSKRETYGGEVTKADDLIGNKAFDAWVKANGFGDRYHDQRDAFARLMEVVGADEKLRNGYTTMGSPKYKPHTLDSVVAYLKKELRGGEGFNYGLGSVRAKYTPQFKSITQIKANSDRLVSKEQFDAIKKEMDDELIAVGNTLAEFHANSNNYGYLDAVTMAMGDAVKMGVGRALTDNGFADVSPEARAKFVEFIVKLRSLPTEYFEAKILREVDLSEFKHAVIPSDTPSDVRAMLESRGLKVTEYGEQTKRAEAVKQAAESSDLVFSLKGDDQQPATTNTHAADVIAKAAKTVNIPLDVYATPREAAAKLGIDIPSDVRGLHYRGRAALISSNITTPAMGEFVLWHELLHAGITQVAPRYGNEYNRIMQDMAARNSNIIKAARDWRNSYGAETIKRSMEAGLSQEQAEKRMRLMAIEEAIADLAGANVELKGWQQFVAKLQALLRSMGFDNLANWIEGKSNAEVLQLIARTREEVTTQNLHLTTQVPAFARDEDDASYQRAYHGTPHKFDKFSLDKIGTGEGAQAYGYGLYFASKREIAEHYRNALGRPDSAGLSRAQDLAAWAYSMQSPYAGDAMEHLNDEIARMEKHGKFNDKVLRSDYEEAKRIVASGEVISNGKLYQVDIPEDSEMLHWDKPLSEQPEAVKVALEKSNPALFQKNWYDAETKQPTELGETSGKMLNGVLSEVMDGSEYYRSLSSQTRGGAQASAKLRSLGIRGIKYLDGVSRNAGDGSYNYVVFDDNDVSIEAVHSRGTNDGMANDKTVVGNTTGRPADDVISGATAASQMLDAIERDPYADYAIRVIPGEFTGSVNVGDTLPVSNKWEDGTDTGKPLRGTSGIGIEQRSLKGVEQAIHRIGSSKTAGPNGFYFGNRVVLIKGESVASGEDVGESVIQNAEVVGVWTKPTKGKSEVQPNEQTTSQNGDVAFSRTGSGDIFDKNATAAQSTYNGTEAVQGIGVSVKNVMRQTANIARDKRGAALSFLGGRQIADIYSKDVPELPKYNEILQRMQAEQNEGSAVADSIIEKWRVINRKRPDVATQLSSLMHDSTLAQVDPDVSADNAELRKRWINLPQEAKDIYREARDAYVAHFEKVKAELIDRVERSALDTSAKNRTLASMREEFTKAMKGVYFPLARFGDYMVVVKDKAGVTQSVSMAETTNQAQALRAELLRAYPDYIVGAIQKKKEFNAERDGVSRGFMKDLVALISEEPDAQTRDSQLDAINQLWLSSLPDLSWAKSGIHRKGTPGYSNDAMRAFARNMFHGGYHLAKLRYGDRLGDTLAQMQETIDNKVRSNPEYSNVVAQSVVDEMNARHKHVMNPQNTPVANALTGLGFMWHMGLSPASAVVNLSQTALVAYPMLASKFGFGKAATMLLSLSADAVKGKNDLLSQLQGAEKDAYDRAVREGLIDVTMAHDLAGVSQGKSGEFNEKQQRVMRVASVMFHEAEKFNRGVTFMSAYRLAVQSGVSDPYKLAHDLTFDSHFDYSSQNRPRVMQGPTARVILLFKQYGQNMIYTLSRNTFKALQGDREAQKTLAGLLAMHGMFAGALGMPLMTTLLAAASAIGGSDDEPWDAQVALRNYLADAFGKDIGEVLAHGVFRAPGIKDAIGADISSRVGLDSMLIRMPQETLEGKKYYQALLETIAGPVFGIGGNIANGMQTMAQGNTLRGIEEMLPKSIKDPLKAYRYEQDGIQDKTGITIVDETTIPEEVAQFLGFSPARGMEGFEGKSAIKNQETLLTQRRRQLMQRYGKDAEEGDTADSLTAIQRWNIANPTMAIKGQDLLRSMREKAKRQSEAENGAYLSKKRRGLAELGEFANAE